MARKLDMLHNLKVYSAPHMVISPSLIRGQLGRPIEGKPIPAKVYLKESSTESKKELQVYIRPQPYDRLPLPELSAQICSFAGVYDEKLCTLVKDILIEGDPQDIHDLLSRANVDGYDDYDYKAAPVLSKPDFGTVEDAGGLEGAHKSVNESVRHSSNAIEESKQVAQCSKTIAASSGIVSETPQALRDLTNHGGVLVAQDPGYRDRGKTPPASSEPAISKIVKQVYQGFSTSSTLPEPCQKVSSLSKLTDVLSNQSNRRKANGYWRSQVFDQQPIARTGRGPRITLARVRDVGLKPAEIEAREERIGIQGELKVFRTLQNIFGEGLHESCWTSELRELAGDEFSRWTPEDPEEVYSDFTIQDAEGRLAAWLVQEGFPVPDHRGDVTYHIEVKATGGSCDEPFHMSALQMNKCEKLSVIAAQWSGQDLFVIFRLYNLGQGAGLMVYVDPWTKINDGSLEREPDGWLVTDRS